MNTFRLRQFAQHAVSLPATTGWYLADSGEARGKQELNTHQAPQKLKVLREQGLIESAVSSNRIEGVVIEQSRIGTVIFAQSLLRDCDEEEVRSYRNALRLVYAQGPELLLAEATILRLRKLSRGSLRDAGQYNQRDSDIIQRYPDGRSRVRFKTVPAAATPHARNELLNEWAECLTARTIHPLIALAAFNPDLLCIHPFRDGNGRVSRLLLLLQSYQLGYEVECYISLECLIEQHKKCYYETLELSSQGWHESCHDPWPYINLVLYILKLASQEFEQRVGQTASPGGSRSELITDAIAASPVSFTLKDLLKAYPGVSPDLIRKTLSKLQRAGELECQGRGPGAIWQ